MLTGNKGEWSEVYALLKLVADKQLYPGDGNLHKLANSILPIIKVLRAESDGIYEYDIQQNLVIINGASNQFTIPISEFQRYSKILFDKIKLATGTFPIPEVEDFMSSFNCLSIKASSNVKSDIHVVLHDIATGTTPELGFSIKSQLGKASTLLNAGKTTNFIFKIQGVSLSTDEINQVNDDKNTIKKRIEKIAAFKKSLTFIKTERTTFSNNLRLIDSGLPEIMAEIVYLFYSSTHTSLADLVNAVSISNPLNFDLSNNHPFYSYKIKRFLTDIALGMMPSRVWTGKLEATGGYLVVKKDGEILSYHIYNRNDFEDYLLKNTKLETADPGRHEFGVVYEDDGAQFFNLNLQIRFIK